MLLPKRGACVCVKPCDPRESSSSHLYVCVQGVQAAHPVLHQRRHWMSAGDIQWDAIGRTCKFLKVGPFSFFPNGFSKQQTCTCMSGSIHVRQTCCVQMWQTCICADMSTNMCGHVAFSCCDMFRSRHVNQKSAEDVTKPSTSFRGCLQVCVCVSVSVSDSDHGQERLLRAS